MSRKSILVIDDDDNVRCTLAAILSQAGYKVGTAGFICDAIESLIACCFDLVLLDLKKPGEDGLALLANLQIAYPGLPVIVMTADSAIDIAKEAERFGVKGYFLKPVDPVLMLDNIKNILSEPELSTK